MLILNFSFVQNNKINFQVVRKQYKVKIRKKREMNYKILNKIMDHFGVIQVLWLLNQHHKFHWIKLNSSRLKILLDIKEDFLVFR